MKKDIIVAGTGCAGLMAALAAEREGAEVLLVDRGPLGIGSNSAMSNGVFAGLGKAYPAETYARDTIKIGKGINNPSYVDIVAKGILPAIDFLRSHGVIVEESDGVFVVRPGRRDLARGIDLMRTLASAVQSRPKIDLLRGFSVTKVVVEDGRVAGIAGIDMKGTDRVMASSSVVLATGGAGAIYSRNDNQKKILGQSFSLAAHAGCDLWDMEFVQFYPLVIDEPTLPSMMVYPPYPGEVRLYNHLGKDITKKNGAESLNELIRFKRDELSLLLFKEGERGPVTMDFTGVPPDGWNRYPLPFMEKINFDFRKRPFVISPGAHFFMGGIRIDDRGMTSVPGLFACGEAVWGLHGANRRGGNALTECIVSGMIAGRHAAEESSIATVSSLKTEIQEPVPLFQSESIDLRELRVRIGRIAWECGGVVRDEEGLSRGLLELDETDSVLKKATFIDPKEKLERINLEAASLTLRAILTASIERKESRGAFRRSDYPEQEDAQWRCNSCLRYDRADGTFSVSHYKIEG